jgi:hypothetical protein
MTISAINSTEIYNPLNTVEPAETPEEHLVQPAEEEAAESAPATLADDNAAETESETKAKGVLRLLEAGHFKGVADVRLRINFHEEIAAMEAEKAAQVTADGVANISEAMTSEIDAYLEGVADEATASMIIEARDTFTSELSRIADDGNLSGKEDAVMQVRSAFESFVSSITPVPEEQPEESPEVIPTESVSMAKAVTATPDEIAEVSEPAPEAADNSALSLDDFIAQLTDSFTAAVVELESSLADISILPPLSEPSGNGKAYDKFVAMYNEMRGGETSLAVDMDA